MIKKIFLSFLISLTLFTSTLLPLASNVQAQATGTFDCGWDVPSATCAPTNISCASGTGSNLTTACQVNTDPTSCNGTKAIACASGAPVFGAAPLKGTWFERDFFEWYPVVYDTNASPETDIYGERYTAAQVEWIIYAYWAFLLHRIIPRPIAACIISNLNNPIAIDACLVTEVIKIVSAFFAYDAQSANIASYIEPRGISGVSYVKEKLHLVPVANAQGFGFQNLGYIQTLWKVSRNFAFSLMILAVIILAFMVMFRMKTSPQTAITVQSAIPRVFVAIILIAFSYAIAGFMIDLVYVFIGAFATLFRQISDTSTSDLYNFMIAGHRNGGIFSVFFEYMFYFPIVAFLALVNLMNSAFLKVLTGFVGGFIVLIISLLVFWLLAIVMWFRVMWSMLKALLGVIVSIIIGPFQIMLGTIMPGMGFGAWIKGLISNLLVFVLAGPMLILSIFFLYMSMQAVSPTLANELTKTSTVIFNDVKVNIPPDQVMGWTPPLLAGSNYVGLIYLFLSFGIISAIPRIAEMVKGFVSGRPMSFGSAIGESLGPVMFLGRQGYGASGAPQIMNAFTGASAVANLDRMGFGNDKSWQFKTLNRMTRGNWINTYNEMRRRAGLDTQ